MKHTELLYDQDALARGEHLVSLYIGGLKQLRINGPNEEEQCRNHDREMINIIDDVASLDEVDSTTYERLGREVTAIRRSKMRIDAWYENEETDTPEWHEAFKPAHDFLETFSGKPIIAEDTRETHVDISSFKIWSARHPKMLGGFIIPKVIGNSQLYIAGRPNSEKAIARLQVFDRYAPDSYRSYLRIAIAD